LSREKGSATPAYHSFLLRLWQESEQAPWRASLERVATGERYGFPDLVSLFAFLQVECQETAARHPPDQPSQRGTDERDAADMTPYG
jgi:hypothetical protein